MRLNSRVEELLAVLVLEHICLVQTCSQQQLRPKNGRTVLLVTESVHGYYSVDQTNDKHTKPSSTS